MSHQDKKRKYELRKRAEQMADTRQRITEAAVELHGAIGPARTTVSAVAERAGVQRHTVYRHFPTEDELLAACSHHYWTNHPWPDRARWEAIADPRERMTTALDELYRWYERTENMLSNVFRDVDLVDGARAGLEPLLDYLERATRVLSAGWGARGARRRVLRAAVRHALDFATWRSLVRDGGIARSQAVRLATAMVESASA